MTRRTNHLRALLALVLAAALAAGLLVLVEAKSAEAAFPGANGKIVFHGSPTGDDEIFTMNPDGTEVTQLTFNTASDTIPPFPTMAARQCSPAIGTATLRST